VRVLTTDGESSAGAVGSSTMISVSGVAIGLFAKPRARCDRASFGRLDKAPLRHCRV
jgi:hypothetical protein